MNRVNLTSSTTSETSYADGPSKLGTLNGRIITEHDIKALYDKSLLGTQTWFTSQEWAETVLRDFSVCEEPSAARCLLRGYDKGLERTTDPDARDTTPLSSACEALLALPKTVGNIALRVMYIALDAMSMVYFSLAAFFTCDPLMHELFKRAALIHTSALFSNIQSIAEEPLKLLLRVHKGVVGIFSEDMRQWTIPLSPLHALSCATSESDPSPVSSKQEQIKQLYYSWIVLAECGLIAEGEALLSENEQDKKIDEVYQNYQECRKIYPHKHPRSLLKTALKKCFPKLNLDPKTRDPRITQALHTIAP